jgi:hypothetical protein
VESTPDSVARLIRDEVVRWTPIVKSLGLKID